jgi:hypothetical protein
MNRFNQHVTHDSAKTPTPKSREDVVHAKSGYSHDVEDNINNLSNPSVIAKEMEKLKNFGTINISDKRSKLKKRETANSNFVRNTGLCKRQNISKGKLPFVEKDAYEGMDTTNIPFNSDYRRGLSAKVIHIVLVT